METETEYIFRPLQGAALNFFKSPNDYELLAKWSMLNGLHVQGYYFDRPFKPYMAKEFLRDLFGSQLFANTFKRVDSSGNFSSISIQAETIEYEEVSCTLITTEIFDRLSESAGIVKASGQITKCLPEDFLPDPDIHDENCPVEVGDLLRKLMIQDIPASPGSTTFEDADLEALYSPEERSEFLFRLFKHFVLGGSLCQNEDTVWPYVNMATATYKSFMTIAKSPKATLPGSESEAAAGDALEDSSDLVVTSSVYRIKALKNESYSEDNLLFSKRHINNFMYLIVHPSSRICYTLYHNIVSGGSGSSSGHWSEAPSKCPFSRDQGVSSEARCPFSNRM